jgi:hypothetical protein
MVEFKLAFANDSDDMAPLLENADDEIDEDDIDSYMT